MLRRMTKVNPYAEALGDRDPLEVLRSTPAALRAELAAQQGDWAERYAAYELEDALGAFLALRQFTLRLLATLKPADYERPLTHPERGTMTVRVFLESFAGHDLTHLDQLRRNWRDLAGAGAAG